MSVRAKATEMAISKIRPDGGTQTSAGLTQETIDEYAEAMREGVEFPPVVVFHDKKASAYWLGDGFHRYHAAKAAGLKKIASEVREGTLREALLFALAANRCHGLRRTNEDKRKAVKVLLRDPEGREWSDRRIAEHCGVDHKTVTKWRGELESTGEIPQLIERKSLDGKA